MSGYTFNRRIQSGKFEILVDEAAQYGYFEHEELGDECGGGLWLEGNVLVDADGTYALPKDVAAGLRAMGFVVTEDFDD